jgi:hypothetical protein
MIQRGNTIFALLDCHLFGPLRNALRVHHFASDHELKEMVHTWLATQPETLFFEVIQTLV